MADAKYGALTTGLLSGQPEAAQIKQDLCSAPRRTGTVYISRVQKGQQLPAAFRIKFKPFNSGTDPSNAAVELKNE